MGNNQMMTNQMLPTDVGLDGAKLQEKFSSVVCAVDCYVAERKKPASVTLDGLRLGAIDVLKYDGYGLKGGGRNFRQIRENETDDFIVLVPLSVSLAVAQSGRSAVIEPGMFGLLSTSRPFDSLCGSPPTHIFTEYMVRVPGSLLRRYVPHIDECCAIPISAKRGAGKVMCSLIESLMEERLDYIEPQAVRFGETYIATLANVTLDAPELLALQDIRQPLAHARVFEKARVFIESNLSNPNLNPALIAGHCYVSISYLHASFAAYSQSVGDFVRTMRLERCHEALRNSALQHQLIIDIAMQWGFNSYSSFNRAYHARFGISPSEERRALSNSSRQYLMN